MSESNRKELAADTIAGVYVCENSEADSSEGPVEILYDMDFYEALDSDFKGTIFGNVSDDIAQKINEEYGINHYK